MDTERLRERKIRFSKREHATLEGWRLEFNKIASRNHNEGYGNIVQDPKSVVEGILYEIPESAMLKLDKCEEYPNHYNKTIVKVRLDNGKEIEATTYMAQSNKIRSGLKPSKEYLAHLLKESDILSEKYYEKLKRWETL